MYKILIKYDKSQYYTNLWMSFGELVESKSGSSTITEFKEYETDNLETLKEKIKELNSIYGSDNIRIVKDITYEITVNISDDNE